MSGAQTGDVGFGGAWWTRISIRILALLKALRVQRMESRESILRLVAGGVALGDENKDSLLYNHIYTHIPRAA